MALLVNLSIDFCKKYEFFEVLEGVAQKLHVPHQSQFWACKALWEILAKSVQKTFSCEVEFKPVTSRIFKCQSNLAIKFYSYFWWISRNFNKVFKNYRNFAFYQSFGRFFQVFFTYTLSEHVRACNFKTGKCIIT